MRWFARGEYTEVQAPSGEALHQYSTYQTYTLIVLQVRTEQVPEIPRPAFRQMMGADRSFVTVGRSFTVAKGFSPLRKGGFAIPFVSLGGVGPGLDTGALKAAVFEEASTFLSAAARVDRHSK